MVPHEQPSELAIVVAALQTEVAALRAESSAARAVRRRSRLQALVPILSLLAIISLSLVLIPTTRAQTPDGATAAEKAQPALSPRLTAVETEKSLASPNTTGGPLLIGQSNAPSNPSDTTILVDPSNTALMQNTLSVNNFSNTSLVGGLIADRRVAIIGSVSGVDTTQDQRIGVIGASDTGIGVYGYSPGQDGYGVYGDSPGSRGDAVFGTGGRYGGYFIGNTASIRLYPSSAAGPPTTGQHLSGELVVSSDGHLWFCRTPGSPGAWVRLDLGSTFVPMVQK